MSTERPFDPVPEWDVERAKRIGNRPFPKFHGDVEEWLCSLRDWLLDPAAVRIVESVLEDQRAAYDWYEDSRAKIADQLDQVECELADMRERFGALSQQYEELCGTIAAKVAAAATAGVVSNSTERTDCNV